MVGLGDTGLDYSSCFFADPDGHPPGPLHRKVIDYRTIADTIDGNGHGTPILSLYLSICQHRLSLLSLSLGPLNLHITSSVYPPTLLSITTICTGTHTAGSIVGQCVDCGTGEYFNGVAPAAKIAFTDLGIGPLRELVRSHAHTTSLNQSFIRSAIDFSQRHDTDTKMTRLPHPGPPPRRSLRVLFPFLCPRCPCAQ